MTMDPALIDRGNLIDGDWANYSWNDSQKNNLVQNYSDKFGNSQQQFTVTDGVCVKSISPHTGKFY